MSPGRVCAAACAQVRAASLRLRSHTEKCRPACSVRPRRHAGAHIRLAGQPPAWPWRNVRPPGRRPDARRPKANTPPPRSRGRSSAAETEAEVALFLSLSGHAQAHLLRRRTMRASGHLLRQHSAEHCNWRRQLLTRARDTLRLAARSLSAGCATTNCAPTSSEPAPQTDLQMRPTSSARPASGFRASRRENKRLAPSETS